MPFAKTRATLTCLAAATLLSSVPALAHEKPKEGYLVDTNGHNVLDSIGRCWRTGYWTPAMATKDCDPDLVKKPEPKKEEPKAEPKAPPPPPPAKAEPKPEPAKPKVEKFVISADVLFDFDKSVLKPAGKDVLDNVADKLQEVKDGEVIIVTGHADFIGTDKYNQKLSERRAETVRKYLVGKGIGESRIRAEGKGESEPVTGGKGGQCKGKRGKSLIQCLAPDRRVEIRTEGQREVK